jgi:glycosyltransferase involved in cell wall biosynthesis
MQEMKKRRIVLASILKPTNDTRMFEKMGLSLARSGRYEVHIIGYPCEASVTESNVHFHPLPKFKRISFGRLSARIKALEFIIKVKSELLIVTTHELLLVAILIRILFGTKIIYDIRENYARNILFTNAFPKLIRPLMAFVVRLKEWVTSPFFSQFLIAEKCYAQELGFIKNKFVAIENKCRVPRDFHRNPNKEFIELIFTGTIAESTGIFQAIDLAKKLHAVNSKIRLTIIGYCAQTNELQKIKNEISNNDFITLTGGDKLVPHSSIMNAIATANFGIVSYPISRHTENRIPTKLYEYLTCQLPILLQNHKPWVETSKPVDTAILVNFENPQIESILAQINKKSLITSSNSDISYAFTWQSEEKKLLDLLNNIF